MKISNCLNLNRIAFITDLHIDQKNLAYGKDTVKNLKDLVISLQGWDLDHIVCGGDISLKEPRISDCKFLKENLDPTEVPYDVIKGNHDDSDDISDVFNYINRDGEIYYDKVIGGKHCIFLDTNQGSISDEQCEWLGQKLKLKDTPFIFMHYPPIETGILFMDHRHQFRDQTKVLDILSATDKTLHIFCGHCHAERFIQTANLNIHITPSAIQQIDERFQEYTPYHNHVGYRIIEFDNGGFLRTFVKYLF
jgi:Icc-related predicted phosphoesterase